MRIGHERCARFFQYGYCLGTADGRKVIKEDFKGITCFEVIEQCLDRNPGSSEDRRPTMNFWVDGD